MDSVVTLVFYKSENKHACVLAKHSGEGKGKSPAFFCFVMPKWTVDFDGLIVCIVIFIIICDVGQDHDHNYTCDVNNFTMLVKYKRADCARLTLSQEDSSHILL